jgi:hypothetical protein
VSLVAFSSHASDMMLTKRQLAEHLGRSERWIELKMRDGLPCLPRTDRQGRRMFRLRCHGYGVRVWDPARKTMRWIGTYPTLAEARRAEAAATLRPERGRPVSVGEWTATWLSDYARSAPATQRTYRYAAEQIKRDLGHLGLPSVDRPLARKMAAAWPRGTTRVARSLFGDALRDGLVEQNLFSQLRLETPKGRKDIDALTESEIHDLATIAERVHDDYGPEAAAIIVTLGYVGQDPASYACSAATTSTWAHAS